MDSLEKGLKVLFQVFEINSTDLTETSYLCWIKTPYLTLSNLIFRTCSSVRVYIYVYMPWCNRRVLNYLSYSSRNNNNKLFESFCVPNLLVSHSPVSGYIK